MHITVGICTWNRAEHLDRTLAEMLKMRIPDGVTWELLVVDNNSTDATQSVIQRYTDRLPIRGLFESRQGKSNACNRLVGEAKGELILWTDDDVLVASDWMEQYLKAAREWPHAAYFGGRIDPLYEANPPRWVEQSLKALEGPLALLDFGPETRPFVGEEIPFGANMAIRTDIQRQHPFDARLGPNGKQLLRGEDMRLIETLKHEGHQGIWVGAARVQHWVPLSRMTKQYVWDWSYNGGITAAREGEAGGRTILGVPRWALRRYLEQSLASACGPLLSPNARIRALRDRAFCAGILFASRQKGRHTLSPNVVSPV